MSQFSQFFNQAAGSAAGVAGNIFAGIRPPKFSSTMGNSHNFNKASNWAVENFIIPNHLGYILGINLGPKVAVADWYNNLVWSATDGTFAATLNAIIYNQVLDKWYMSGTGNGLPGVYEVNILNGVRTLKVPNNPPDFLSQEFPKCACLSYCTADGLYEWRNGTTINKYDQNFIKVQTRAYTKTNAPEYGSWYYTEDCKIRVQSVTSWLGQGSASSITVTPDAPVMLLERYGSRRLVELTAEMVFSARVSQGANNFEAATMTPMVPTIGQGAYLGNAVRIGGTTRNSDRIPDTYLLDRADYDRWLGDVCDALGMPKSDPFFGDLVNV